MKMRALPVASTKAELEMMIAESRKSGKRIAYGWFLFSLLVAGWIVSQKMEPILELSEMEVDKGVLVDFVDRSGYRNFGPKIILQKDDGSTFAILANAATGNPQYTAVKQLVGKRITVWVQDTCLFSGYFCSPSLNQLQYQGKMIVDYNNFVRINMERYSEWSIYGSIIFIIPFFTFLLGVLALYLSKGHIKKMRSAFEMFENKGLEG